MGEEQTLPRRKAEILRSIVREYIETGEPVASRTISKRRRRELSSASIRNVMADLADEGYLTQPHTSAGRIPTGKAFRFFVMELMAKPPAASAERKLLAGFSGVENLEQGIERSSQLLTDLTRNVGIAASFPAAGLTLNQVELLALADDRVLAVLVTGDRVVRHRVVTPDEAVSQEDLISIRNYINQNFSGWVLADVREELERRLRLQSVYYDALQRRLNLLFSRGLLDIGLAPAVHMGGASYLIALDLHLTREKMRELLHALEEKKRILQLLDRILEQPPGEVSVHVGLGDLHPAMGELSLIGVNIAAPGGMAARVAVLGPMRMHYERVMTAVLGVGRTLQELPC